MGAIDIHRKKRMRIEIGERVRREREAVGMDRSAMAERLGVSEKTIKNIETGVTGTTIYRMIDISDILHSSLDFLLRGERNELMRSEEKRLAEKAACMIHRVPAGEKKILLEMMVAIYGGMGKIRDLK